MNPKVELHIAGGGVITLELDEQKAPKTVANFLSYVKKGHYDGTIFHRVIDGFMVQGGGFAPGMTQNPHSASAQFFINVSDNAFLNHTAPTAQGWGYAVFGKVVGGQDVVDRIKGVPTGNRGGHGDVPKTDVVVEKAVVV
ncbi:MAG: cyclophilin [Ramlibacter sp.]|nr:cyclophilin [Ramlibacter sp.]